MRIRQKGKQNFLGQALAERTVVVFALFMTSTAALLTKAQRQLCRLLWIKR